MTTVKFGNVMPSSLINIDGTPIYYDMSLLIYWRTVELRLYPFERRLRTTCRLHYACQLHNMVLYCRYSLLLSCHNLANDWRKPCPRCCRKECSDVVRRRDGQQGTEGMVRQYVRTICCICTQLYGLIGPAWITCAPIFYKFSTGCRYTIGNYPCWTNFCQPTIRCWCFKNN